MCYLHRRSQEAFAWRVVVSNMLDCLPSGLHQEMVDQRGLRCCSTTGRGWRDATSEAMALSWMQSAEGCPAQELPLLVREGARSQICDWTAAIFVWPDMCSTTSPAKELSTSLSSHLSCRSLPALWPHGAYKALLLRQEVSHATLY